MELIKIDETQRQVYSKMSVDTYKPTPTIDRLNIEEINKVLFDYIMISGLDNIPDMNMIIFISEGILAEFPKMEIGELHMAMRNGILGTYGPLYNKISIDMPLTWVRKFYEVTFALIEQKAFSKNSVNFKIEENEAKYVPAPKEIQEKTDQLIRSLKINKHKPLPESKDKYKSIEHFCEVKGYDSEWYSKEFAKVVLVSMPKEESPELWIAQCRINHLIFLNSQKGEVVFIALEFINKWFT